VAKKQRIENKKRLLVTMHHVPTPDGNARLSRAIDIVLKAAAEANSQSKDTPNGKKETPHGQAPAVDTLTRGSGGNDFHGEG
jgi:hypothetical protein